MTKPIRCLWAGLLLILSLLPALTACRTDGARATYTPGKLKLLVEDDGPYRLSRGELEKLGIELPAPLDAGSLRLSSAGKDVPILIEDDALIFYGRGSENRYYAARPYLLESGTAGQTMATREDSPAGPAALDTVRRTLHLEENHIYLSEARQHNADDVWFWAKLAQGDTLEVAFELPGVAGGPAELRLNGWGVTHNPEVEGDHDLQLLLNDSVVGEVSWDGQTSHTADLPLAAGVLHEGPNTFVLDNSAEGASFLDIVQFNWLEVTYPAPPRAVDDRLDFTSANGTVAISGFSETPLLLDVSDPDEPRRVLGWTFADGTAQGPAVETASYVAAAPGGFLKPAVRQLHESTLSDPEQQADFIIITTSELAASLAPLTAARQREGLAVVVATVEEIYDTFGYGAPSPESIHSFLHFAYESWQEPRPRYVLLVGDATSDYRAYTSSLPDNYVPSYMVPVQFSGETVSDSRLADVDGDTLPEMAIGRWPVNSAQEVAALVERTLAYEGAKAASPALFATDGSESTFSIIAARLAEEGGLPPAAVEQLDGPTAAELGQTWRAGTWLATYVGHGSIDRWGKEDMFSLDELDHLSSGGETAPPIVIQLTCLTGLFSSPEQVSLSEAMLRHAHGPVLIVAASSLTLSAYQEPFAVALLQQLQDTSILRVGDAFLDAKRALDVENSDGLREISDTFALFGDPSAAIVRPEQ